MRIDLTIIQYLFYLSGSLAFLAGSLIGHYQYLKGLKEMRIETIGCLPAITILTLSPLLIPIGFTIVLAICIIDIGRLIFGEIARRLAELRATREG